MTLSGTITSLGNSIIKLVDTKITKAFNTTGLDKINQSKALETGAVSSDNSVYKDIENYRHSTFDRSKFTVVGSPVINDDGIASGFSNSNCLTYSSLNFGSATEEVILYGKCKVSSITTSGQALFILNSNSVRFSLEDSRLTARIGQASNFAINYVCQPNDVISWNMKIGKNQTYITITEINGSKVEYSAHENTITLSSIKNATAITFGHITNYNFQGSIDLSQFSITVDGVEVFNGNKTGMDVIKEDNYTTVTTLYAYTYTENVEGIIDDHTIYADSSSAPTALYYADGSSYTGTEFSVTDSVVYYGKNTCTYEGSTTITTKNGTVDAGCKISEEGIASGFSDSNYLTTSLGIVNFNEYEIYSPIIDKQGTAADRYVWATDSSTSTDVGHINITTYSNSIGVYNYIGNTSTGVVTTQIPTQAGSKYRVKIKCKDKTVTLYVSKDGGEFKQVTSYTITYNQLSLNFAKIGSIWQSGHSFDGSLDLNSFKVYVDGKLIYQPMLKIPYTLSKTGSKIVNSTYRDRVTDVYEQYGKSPYYTIDEENKDFTLPQGEVYGMVGSRILYDSYQNGAEFYNLYLDGYLEQGGSCTSGTSVTLLKEFKDNNYNLSIPYSAKTASNFTPSQTGDWIAKGYTYLD